MVRFLGGAMDTKLDVCSFCGRPRSADKLVRGNGCSICAGCVWRAMTEFDRRNVDASADAALRSARVPARPCDLCGGPGSDPVRGTPYAICAQCGADLGRFILHSSRETLTALFGITIEETTNIRRVSGGLADHVADSGRTHAELAKSYVEAGDYGDALTEASIALVSRPAVPSVVAQALEVLLGSRFKPDLGALRTHLKKRA